MLDSQTGKYRQAWLQLPPIDVDIWVLSLYVPSRGGMLFDTPGFNSFDLPDIDEDRLKYYYPEFAEI